MSPWNRSIAMYLEAPLLRNMAPSAIVSPGPISTIVFPSTDPNAPIKKLNWSSICLACSRGSGRTVRTHFDLIFRMKGKAIAAFLDISTAMCRINKRGLLKTVDEESFISLTVREYFYVLGATGGRTRTTPEDQCHTNQVENR